MSRLLPPPAAAGFAGLGLFLSACASHQESGALPRETGVPPLRLLSAGAGTEVQFKWTVELQLVDIQCPRGIGWAEFALPAGVRPDITVFRLHLRGLEGLTVTHGGSRVQVAVSSHGDLAIREWREDGEPLAEINRVPVSVVPEIGGRPRIPLDGWFELGPPPSCAGGCSLKLEWVDFYR